MKQSWKDFRSIIIELAVLCALTLFMLIVFVFTLSCHTLFYFTFAFQLNTSAAAATTVYCWCWFAYTFFAPNKFWTEKTGYAFFRYRQECFVFLSILWILFTGVRRIRGWYVFLPVFDFHFWHFHCVHHSRWPAIFNIQMHFIVQMNAVKKKTNVKMRHELFIRANKWNWR